MELGGSAIVEFLLRVWRALADWFSRVFSWTTKPKDTSEGDSKKDNENETLLETHGELQRLIENISVKDVSSKNVETKECENTELLPSEPTNEQESFARSVQKSDTTSLSELCCAYDTNSEGGVIDIEPDELVQLSTTVQDENSPEKSNGVIVTYETGRASRDVDSDVESGVCDVEEEVEFLNNGQIEELVLRKEISCDFSTQIVSNNSASQSENEAQISSELKVASDISESKQIFLSESSLQPTERECVDEHSKEDCLNYHSSHPTDLHQNSVLG